MKQDRGYYDLKKEIGEVKDLVQELMRRLGNLELRGTVQYGQPNHISQQSIQFNLQSQRTINGKLVGDIEMEEKNRWDRLKEIKLDTPKEAVKKNIKDVIKNDKRFDVKKPIDEMEWLNLLEQIRSGFDAFQRGDFTDDKVREQISGVILNKVKKWLEDKEL
tara:strand:+ start:255 stop:740 length:486 start_codon:yes stop_codon:yes gene_type:complete